MNPCFPAYSQGGTHMFGNKAQMQNMLKKARKMQEELQKKQEALKKQTIDVSVGGGAVALTMNGEKQIVALKIAKDAIDPEDPEMLEDLITTAVNEAGKKADEMVQKSMSEVTGGLGLPGGMF
jgi:DNA-binding YbaB/EbfC family protein